MGKTFVDKSYMGFFRSQSFRRGTTTENVLNGSRDAFVFRPIRWFQGSFFPDMKPRRRENHFWRIWKVFLEMISLEENRKNWNNRFFCERLGLLFKTLHLSMWWNLWKHTVYDSKVLKIHQLISWTSHRIQQSHASLDVILLFFPKCGKFTSRYQKHPGKNYSVFDHPSQSQPSVFEEYLSQNVNIR